MLRRAHFLLLLLALAPLAVAAPLQLGGWYKDESNGFKLKIPAKWDQVPTKFQEVSVLGKWSGNARRGYYAPDCHVLRFLDAPAGGEDPGLTGEGPRGIPGYGTLLRFQPKDLWEYIKSNFGFYELQEEADPDFKPSAKDLKIEFKIFRAKPRGQPGRETDANRPLIYAAQVESPEGGTKWGILYSCTVADEETMGGAFRSSIRSFRLIEPDVEEVAEEGEIAATDSDIFVDSESKPEEWRAARKRKLIPGWKALDTRNYLVVYNDQVQPALVKNIAKHIEAIRAQVYEKLFPPAREVKAISVVRICKDPEEYFRYGGPGGSAGYWSRGDEELVFYQDKSNKKDSLRVLYHEAFHQYIHYAVGDVAPHSWFNEGHGDYFAGFNYSGGKFVSDVFRWRTGIIADAIGRKSYVPLKQFLKYTQGQYYANANLCYAQGWSLVYFLREVERRKLAKYKKYFGLLDRYFEGIKANVQSVKEKGLEGLGPAPDPGPVPGGPETPEAPGVPAEGPTIGSIPGLEQPFPGEHPTPGRPAPGKEDTGETVTTAGPRITGFDSALDVAVDDAFKGIDLDQLEKDWVEFSKGD